jgi:hypothetical protein
VGPSGSYAALELVPFELLKAGDTVRLDYNAGTPYRTKFMIMGSGTANAPIRVCGIPGPNGERPIIDGNGAKSRAQLAQYISGDAAYARPVFESRSIIQIKGDASTWTAYPQYIQIDGLNIRNAYPGNSYTNTAGQIAKYGRYAGVNSADDPFIACIWADRGQNITFANNEISGCPIAIYTKSLDDGAFAVTKNIRIAGNYMWGAGYPGEVHEHTTYTESQNIVIEFNRFGPLLSTALGNSVKDRSSGTVVRYNVIEDGAHAIDLVEAEDFPNTALADPNYRNSFVYGNIINKVGDLGSVIHYGGDHFGSAIGAAWGEPLFRQGVLYFFNNTVSTTGTDTYLFQISTTLEKVEAWNNVFLIASTNKYLRAPQYQIDPPPTSSAYNWIPGGLINLGRNWISSGWTDTDMYHTMAVALTGSANMLSGSSAPIDTTTFVPLAGSAVVDVGVAGPSAASAYAVNNQISASYVAAPRAVKGAAIDLGAIEK